MSKTAHIPLTSVACFEIQKGKVLRIFRNSKVTYFLKNRKLWCQKFYSISAAQLLYLVVKVLLEERRERGAGRTIRTDILSSLQMFTIWHDEKCFTWANNWSITTCIFSSNNWMLLLFTLEYRNSRRKCTFASFGISRRNTLILARHFTTSRFVFLNQVQE